MTETREIRHFHLFCGSGGGAIGFNRGHARVGSLEARFRCIGGVDSDARAIKDFTRLTGAQGTVLDLFDTEQYRAVHGFDPDPDDWQEATPEDIRRAANNERPHIVFTSSPCKGLSGLLNPKLASKPKYQALNRLTVRGIQLTLAAWENDPPELIIFENVPMIATKGRPLLNEIVHELEMAGYAVAETVHDCGEIGDLAQHRRRFLLVARHKARVRPRLFEPPKLRSRLRGVGEVLGALPLPDDPRGGPMHRSPNLEWRTWVRLALIPAGGDWRSLQGLEFQRYGIERLTGWHGGVLGVTRWEDPAATISGGAAATTGAYSVADPRQDGVKEGAKRHNDVFRVVRWDGPAGAVTGGTGPSSGGQSVADPRPPGTLGDYHIYGVTRWGEPAETVTSQSEVGSGRFAVSDPRPGLELGRSFEGGGHYGVNPWDEPAVTVTGSMSCDNGRASVADPRIEVGGVTDPRAPGWGGRGKYLVNEWTEPAGTVIAASGTGVGAASVADPRWGGGGLGVTPWDEPSATIVGESLPTNGAFATADPRPLPWDNEQCCPWIVALDGTRHRPFTTLELAALQSFPVEELMAEPMAGKGTHWREHVGNGVPPASAAAVASTMGRTLLMEWSGTSFALSSESIWVRRVEVAVSIAQPGER